MTNRPNKTVGLEAWDAPEMPNSLDLESSLMKESSQSGVRKKSDVSTLHIKVSVESHHHQRQILEESMVWGA